MGDRLWVGKQSRVKTSHTGRFSLLSSRCSLGVSVSMEMRQCLLPPHVSLFSRPWCLQAILHDCPLSNLRRTSYRKYVIYDWRQHHSSTVLSVHCKTFTGMENCVLRRSLNDICQKQATIALRRPCHHKVPHLSILVESTFLALKTRIYTRCYS